VATKTKAKVAATMQAVKGLDEGRVWQVFRALPGSSPLDAALMAQDDELFNRVAKGNLTASENEQLYKKHLDPQGSLPGLGGGGLFDE
jgi:hypothetical protein